MVVDFSVVVNFGVVDFSVVDFGVVSCGVVVNLTVVVDIWVVVDCCVVLGVSLLCAALGALADEFVIVV